MIALLSKLLLLLVFPLSAFYPKEAGKHPFHVSTTEITLNEKSKSLEIVCRVFTDDFEQILSKRYKAKTDLHSKDHVKQMNMLIERYMTAQLKFTVDGKVLSPKYIGFENDHEASNVYLEIENISTFKQLQLSNAVLYDLFDDQMNILHVEHKGTRKSTKVNFPERQMFIQF